MVAECQPTHVQPQTSQNEATNVVTAEPRVTSPPSLQAHKAQALGYFNEVVQAVCLRENWTPKQRKEAYKQFNSFFKSEGLRRQEIQNVHLKPLEELLDCVESTVKDQKVATNKQEYFNTGNKIIFVHGKLAEVTAHLRGYHTQGSPESYWLSAWERSLLNSSKDESEFQNSFPMPMIMKKVVPVFKEFDLRQKVLNSEAWETLRTAETLSLSLGDEIVRNVAARRSNAFSAKERQMFEEWQYFVVTGVRKIRGRAKEDAKSDDAVREDSELTSPTVVEQPVEQVALSRHHEQCASTEQAAESARSEDIQPEDQKRLSKTDCLAEEAEADVAVIEERLKAMEVEVSVKDHTVNDENRERLDLPNSDDNPTKVSVTNPESKQSAPTAPVGKGPIEAVDFSSWTHNDSSLVAEKPKSGRAFLAADLKKEKVKTRGMPDPAKVEEVVREPELSTDGRILWRFSNASNYTTIRKIFPFAGEIEADKSITWNNLRMALESPPMNFRFVRTRNAVECTFERAPTEDLPQMSITIHRPHELKPVLDKFFIARLKTRLRQRFGWEAEDFILVQGDVIGDHEHREAP